MKSRIVAHLALLTIISLAVIPAQPALADPSPPVTISRPALPSTGNGPKPLDPRIGRPGDGALSAQPSRSGLTPPRKRSLAAAANGSRGANINLGHSISAVYAAHYLPFSVELPAVGTTPYVYTTLKPPTGCLEAVTGHYRAVGDVTRHILGFYDWCGAQWKTTIELSPDQRAKYVSGSGYIYVQVYRAGTGPWWGIAYNWQTPGWDHLASTATESAAPGWTAFEQGSLESAGCPTLASHYMTDIQVWAGSWSFLASPQGTYFGPNPASSAACVRSYYWDYWYQWPALWSWTMFYATPTWLTPLPAGIERRVTTPPGVGSHSTQPNLYAYDFSGVNSGAEIFGTDVVAARAGTVTWMRMGAPDSGCCVNTENIILIAHPDGKSTVYAHLKQNSEYVTTGQTVKAGQKIAQVGNSGLSTAAHLHFHANTGLDANGILTDSVAIQFNDIGSPAQNALVVSDNWPQP